jgi:predicted dehydrogenase
MKAGISTRRTFLKRSSRTVAAAGLAVPYLFAARSSAAVAAPSERRRVASIGVGTQGTRDATNAARHADFVAVCDVDRTRAERIAQGQLGHGKTDVYQDYRRILDRQDVDVVTVSTPDHWHVKIAVEALRAGKDVYCQKPMSLAIAEGQVLCRVARESGRVIAVGTQNRGHRHVLEAVALARGRLGQIKSVTVAFNQGRKGGPFKPVPVPPHLDWNMWLGQAPETDYIPERTHDTFRWWYEYSGGEITDWGAHFVDLAQWAIGAEQTGPTRIEPLSSEFQVPYQQGYPTASDVFNTPTQFSVRCVFGDGLEMRLQSGGRAGITLETEQGTVFFHHGGLYGGAVEALRKSDPVPPEELVALRKGKPLGRSHEQQENHMENFFQCVYGGGEPASDVFSHHRTLTTCHLANIALRLGRALKWDPDREQILDDEEAARFLARTPRQGFEINGA